MTERERLMVEVLRSDYQLMVRLATDRLASLNEAFPPERRPEDSQTGRSWERERLQLVYEPADRLV